MKRKFIILFSFFFLFINNVTAFNKAPVDITTMNIVELSDALDKGYINSELLVNLYLDRIKEYDVLFNSINQINENAIEEARILDKEREEGKVRSSLHGIPIIVKTNIDVVGLATTGGTKALSDNYPIDDSDVVKKLRESGAIIIASANMSELAFSAANSYSSYGNVKNVFNTDYSPLGSSGGSAVAIKAFFAAASLGTDTNSSVRLPASAAGLVGIRPTYGLLSNKGVIPYDIERDTVGVLSNTVSDNAIILGILSGNDYYSNINKDVSNLKVGVVDNFVQGFNGASLTVNKLTASSIYNMSNDSIKKLEDSGIEIVHIENIASSKNLSIASSTMAGITMCDNFNEYIKGTNGSIRNFKKLVLNDGHVYRLSGYAAGCNHKYKDKSIRDSKKEIYRNNILDIYDKYDVDVLVYPSMKNEIFTLSGSGSNSPGSSLGSVIGFPSITVPMGFDEKGFSYGLEFMTRSGQEQILYDISNEFEVLNGNLVSPSSLTPSLYEISDEVKQLVNNYDLLTTKENKSKDDINFLNKVKNYFVNYNESSDVEIDASKLNEEYLTLLVNNNKSLAIKESKSNSLIFIICCNVVFLIILTFFVVKKKIKKV